MPEPKTKFVQAAVDDPKPDFAVHLGRKVAKLVADAETRGRMGGWADAIEHLRQGAASTRRRELAFAAEYLDGLGVALPETAPSAPSEPVRDQPRVLGYVVLTEGADGRWNDDWDGNVHDDLASGRSALAECREFGGASLLAVLTEVVEPDGD